MTTVSLVEVGSDLAVENAVSHLAPAVGLVTRLDSWVNAITGLGGTRDKAAQAAFYAGGVLTDTVLQALYAEDDLASIVVDAPVEDAFRRGVDVVQTAREDGEDEDTDTAKRIADRIVELGWGGQAGFNTLADCLIWGRLYGGAALLLGAEDGQEPTAPLNEERVSEVRYLLPLEAMDFCAASYYRQLREPKFGQVSTYLLTPGSGSMSLGTIVAHESRLILCPGRRTPPIRRRANGERDHSVLQPVYHVLRDFNSAWQSIGIMLQDSSQAVFKIKNLIENLAGKKKADLLARMEITDICRSVARAILVDAEHEDFTYAERAFSGVGELADRYWTRLAAAARIPVSRFAGLMSTGLNQSGVASESTRDWYDQVAVFQRDIAQPRASRLVRIVAASLQVAEPDRWGAEFPPLWEQSDKERADTQKVVADIDKIYIDAQVYLPEEVALARSENDGTNLGFPKIDLALRTKILDIELEKELKAAEKPDPVPPVPPQGLTDGTKPGDPDAPKPVPPNPFAPKPDQPEPGAEDEDEDEDA